MMKPSDAADTGLRARAVALLGQPLVANAGYLWGVSLVGSLVGFVFWALAAYYCSPDEVGVGSAVVSAAELVSRIAILGVGMGLIRFLPGARDPSRLLNSAIAFSTPVSLLAAAVYLLGLALWSPSLLFLRRDGVYVLIFLIYVLVNVLGVVMRSAFIARRRAAYGLAQTLVTKGVRLALVVVLAGLGAVGLVSSIAAGLCVALVVSAVWFLPRVEPDYRPRIEFAWEELKPMVPYSLGNYVANLASQSAQVVLPLLTLEILGAKLSGYSYIVWMISSFLISPGLALAGSAFAEGSNLPLCFKRTFSHAVGLAMLVTLPLALGAGLTAPWLLRLGFGADYAREAGGLLRWLAGAAPLVVLARLYFTYLRVHNRIGRLVAFSFVIGLATLGVSAAFLPRLGIPAGGIGWLLGNALVALFGALDFLRRQESTSVGGRPSVPMVKPLVVAALPCYNEEQFVEEVVRRARQHVDVVVVVDDGSSDATVEVARRAGAQVIHHRQHRGPAAAARSCLQVGRDLEADVLVTLDGNGQHDPDEIPDVITPLLAGEADLVIGSRFLARSNNVARCRRFGIDVITFLFNFGARERITDAQSGFRAYNRRALGALRITASGFGFSVEALVQARYAGLRIRESSISRLYHQESHTVNPVLHGLGVALMVLKHRLLAAFGFSQNVQADATPDPASTSSFTWRM